MTKQKRTYTAPEVARMLGKTTQAISRYAQNHPGIGQKYGRDWVFGEDDVEKLRAVKMGAPKRSRKKAAQATQPEGGSDAAVAE